MFSKVLRRAAILAVLSLAAACQTANFRHIDPAQREATRPTQVIAVVPQPDLEVYVPQQNTTVVAVDPLTAIVGSITASVMDSVMHKSALAEAEKRIAPMRDQLLDYDFDAQLKTELERTVGTLAWLAPQGVAINKDGTDEARIAELKAATTPTVLYVNTSYRMSPDFSELAVSAYVALYPRTRAWAELTAEEQRKRQRTTRKNAALRASNAIYYNTIVVGAGLPEKSKNFEENRAKWLEGDLFKRSLQYQVTELARMVARDLEAATPTAVLGQWQEWPQRGAILEQSDVAKLVRFDDGTLKLLVNPTAVPAAVTAGP